MNRSVSIVGLLWLGAAWSAAAGQETRESPRPVRTVPLAERLGSAHVAGKYSFGKGDFLNEGADAILKTGMRVIKTYLYEPASNYPFHSEWPANLREPVAIARHPYYRELFRKPFKTFLLTTYSTVHKNATYWRSGMSDTDAAREEEAFHALAIFLMQTYRGTGKTFVLQHWEGDWHLRGTTRMDVEHDASAEAAEGMARWLNARQDGVSRARREMPRSDVKVYHACELNLVVLGMKGRPVMVNTVVPKTRCDLYSYSAYDSIGVAAAGGVEQGRQSLRDALDYIAAKAPDSAAFGSRNVYVGEFGWPEVPSKQDPDASTEKSLRVLRATVEEAVSWGCPYIVYWQVYDNESRVGRDRPGNGDVRGFYLIRPDGTRAAAWDYFASLLKTRR